MTIEILIAVLAIVATIAAGAERLIEIAKPFLEKIKDPGWLKSAKVAAAVGVSFGLAALFRFDMLARLTIVGTLPVVGYAAAGLTASIGSSGLHAILEWLKTLQENRTSTTTKTTSETVVKSSPLPADEPKK